MDTALQVAVLHKEHIRLMHNMHNFAVFSWELALVNLAHTTSTRLARRSIFSFAHYNDIVMGMMASQITSLTIVYATIYSGTDQRKHQSFAPLAFVRGIQWWPVNSLHKWPVTRKMFPFDDVIMRLGHSVVIYIVNYYIVENFSSL